MIYRVTYWKPDKRCNDNCKIVSKEFESREQALEFIDSIPKVIGDGVQLWTLDGEDFEKEEIILPEERRMI